MRWRRYAEPRDVDRMLSHRLVGRTSEAVRQFAQEQGMEVSELVDNVVYASAPAASAHPVILAKWLVQFHFDGDQLREIQVERGLIGP